MDLIKFERQLIVPATALENDMLIYNLCNEKHKDLEKQEERNLISFINAFDCLELVVDTKNWTYIVNEFNGKPKKLKSFNRGKIKYKADQNLKTYVWTTFEILNYLQIAFEKKYDFRKFGNPLKPNMRYFTWVRYDKGFAMVTKNYESLPIEISFALLE